MNIAILLISCILVYAHYASLYALPYLHIFASLGGFVSMIQAICSKWALAFGAFGVFYSVLSIVISRKVDDSVLDSSKAISMQWFIVGFYSVIIFLTIL